MATLIIAFEAPGKQPLSVATIHDPQLLRQAAFCALVEAEHRAEALVGTNPILARLQAAELQRLLSALQILVPDLTDNLEPDRTAVVQ
jgi:hypothetical protein